LANYLVIQLCEGVRFGDDFTDRPETTLLDLGITPIQLDALKEIFTGLHEQAQILLSQ
jgi:hypothetical protein